MTRIVNLQGKPVSQARINCWRSQRRIVDKLFGGSDKKSQKRAQSDGGGSETVKKVKQEETGGPISCHSKLVAEPPPLRLFYNKVRDSPATRNDRQSLYFTDLLHPSLGTLKSSLQVLFSIE